MQYDKNRFKIQALHSMGWIGTFVWGVFIVVMAVIFEAVQNVWNEREWDLKTMLEESLPFWMFVGFVVVSLTRWQEKEIEKEKERLANVPERPLIRAIRAKSIKSTIESIKLFLKGTFYFGGSMWVAFVVSVGLKDREWDLMFDMLPLFLLFGFVMGCFMHVLVNLTNLKGRKT